MVGGTKPDNKRNFILLSMKLYFYIFVSTSCYANVS